MPKNIIIATINHLRQLKVINSRHATFLMRDKDDNKEYKKKQASCIDRTKKKRRRRRVYCVRARVLNPH